MPWRWKQMPQSQDSPSAFPPTNSTGPSGHRLSTSAAEGGGSNSIAAATAGVGGASTSTSKRSSLPPGFRPLGHLGQYNTNPSPLQRALTPPGPDQLGPHDAEPFPSVESLESAGSGHNFHISASGLPTSVSSNDNTSPLMRHQHHGYQHSQSSSFGSKADALESKCHQRPFDRPADAWTALTGRYSSLCFMFAALAAIECICMHGVHLWRMLRLCRANHLQSSFHAAGHGTHATRVSQMRRDGRQVETI
jgi:hypothetical protein